MVVSAFTFNGEYDLLEIHLAILYPYVDQFIICEAKTTFSGNKKPLYYAKKELRYKPYWKKIKYFVIDEDYTEEEIALAENSPNTRGAAHWKNEFLQKESIKKALTHLKDDDIVYIGDVDEIPYSDLLTNKEFANAYFATVQQCYKLKLDVYAYYLNNRSSEQFWGTLVGRYKDIKNECLNHLRTNAYKNPVVTGWHFTSMGGLAEVRRKLNDSYTTESYNTYEVQEKLPARLTEGVDYLGRPFTFTLDESHWPTYLKEHRWKYRHLIKDYQLA